MARMVPPTGEHLMKLHTALCVAALATGTLACASALDLTAPPELVTVPIVDPWSAMNLPIDTGQIIACDNTRCTIAYPKGSATALAPVYATALLAAGFTEGGKNSLAGAFSGSYTRDGTTVILSVVTAAGITTVTVAK